MELELAIVGAGMMAEAIVRGILRAGTIRASQMKAADPSAERRQVFEASLKIAAVEKAVELVAARAVLLGVKPYQMQQVLEEIGPRLAEGSLLISIAAGVSTAAMESALPAGKRWRVIRAMPNTPMLVGYGMVAIAAGKFASKEDMSFARGLFESSAKVLEVSEEKMDAVTAVSGSGPAYFFFLTEQMIQSGIEMGLSPEEARTLAIQTAAGAAKMMAESADEPAEHRRRVTTPNGTTHAAITHMESGNWPAVTREALKAAQRRSRELGKK
jgi:pyrroline-5-carboxylate reductase